MLILYWEYWVGCAIALVFGVALGRLWCSRALVASEADIAVLEEVLRDRIEIDRLLRAALGIGATGSTLQAVRQLTVDNGNLTAELASLRGAANPFRGAEKGIG